MISAADILLNILLKALSRSMLVQLLAVIKETEGEGVSAFRRICRDIAVKFILPHQQTC